MATSTKPLALNESINTTENTPRNIADVLADELSNIADKIQGGGSGGGHVIQDASGTDQTQEPKLQFKGIAEVSNDGTNSRTVVNVPNGHGYGTCTATVDYYEQTVVLAGFELIKGSIVSVLFDHDVTMHGGGISPVYDLSLNVNNTGKKYIKVNGTTPANSSTIVKANTVGTFQYDGTYYNLINTGSGHIIQDSAGTDMTQRSKMQFTDSHITDDSTNEKTIVENIKPVTRAQFEVATEDGFYEITDEDDATMEEASADYVEVTADGVKTLSALLDDLFNDSKFDLSKIKVVSVLKVGNEVYQIIGIGSNSVSFGYANTVSTYDIWISAMTIKSSGSNSWITTKATGSSTINHTDNGQAQPPNGTKITLYYGTNSAVTNLINQAKYTYMESGESVESALTPISIATGITNVFAYKVRNITTLCIRVNHMSAQENSWTVIGNLPTSLQPIMNYLPFLGYDNNATSPSENTAQLRINQGQLQVYAFNGQSDISPFATVTYITN